MSTLYFLVPYISSKKEFRVSERIWGERKTTYTYGASALALRTSAVTRGGAAAAAGGGATAVGGGCLWHLEEVVKVFCDLTNENIYQGICVMFCGSTRYVTELRWKKKSRLEMKRCLRRVWAGLYQRMYAR